MTDRERFVACLRGEPVDRPPYWLFWSPWRTAWARWKAEGKPPEISDHRTSFDPDALPMVLPLNFGPCPRIERQVLEEDDEFRITRDSWGIIRRDFRHSESMSEFLSFPVKNRRDWEQFKEERLDPDHADRLAGDWREKGDTWMEKGWPIQLGCFPDLTVFGGLRWLLGDEECLIAFYTMPDLVHEIMDHLTSVHLTVMEKAVAEVRIDVIHIWEDMCGRQGSLISPQHWREFMGPCYRRMAAFRQRHDIPLMSVDTDGNSDTIMPPMMEAGVNFLFPLEVAAGCDVNAMRKKYPEMGFMGGIDKRALAVGPPAIDRELARVAPAVRTGRYIPDLDHLVPDDVSWENYCYYAEALKRLVGKA
jgi:hypothetical protein